MAVAAAVAVHTKTLRKFPSRDSSRGTDETLEAQVTVPKNLLK